MGRSKALTPDELNAALAAMDDLPETKSPRGLALSSSLRGKSKSTEAIKAGSDARKNSEAWQKHMESFAHITARPCTVDGVTIYPSRRALLNALGWTDGVRHPNFRYVDGKPQPKSIEPIKDKSRPNRNAKPCSLDGVEFDSIGQMMTELKLTISTYKLKKLPGFKYIERKK